jgi:hypothetical protein
MAEKKESLYFGSYDSFSKILRTWLVAYGIGAPVLFATQAGFSQLLIAHGIAAKVIVLFVGGAGLQAIGAFIYKIVMWYLYYGENKEKFRTTWRYRSSHWLSEQVWLDVVFDGGAIVAFGYATWLVTLVFVAPAG